MQILDCENKIWLPIYWDFLCVCLQDNSNPSWSYDIPNWMQKWAIQSVISDEIIDY